MAHYESLKVIKNQEDIGRDHNNINILDLNN